MARQSELEGGSLVKTGQARNRLALDAQRGRGRSEPVGSFFEGPAIGHRCLRSCGSRRHRDGAEIIVRHLPDRRGVDRGARCLPAADVRGLRFLESFIVALLVVIAISCRPIAVRHNLK